MVTADGVCLLFGYRLLGCRGGNYVLAVVNVIFNDLANVSNGTLDRLNA